MIPCRSAASRCDFSHRTDFTGRVARPFSRSLAVVTSCRQGNCCGRPAGEGEGESGSEPMEGGGFRTVVRPYVQNH